MSVHEIRNGVCACFHCLLETTHHFTDRGPVLLQKRHGITFRFKTTSGSTFQLQTSFCSSHQVMVPPQSSQLFPAPSYYIKTNFCVSFGLWEDNRKIWESSFSQQFHTGWKWFMVFKKNFSYRSKLWSEFSMVSLKWVDLCLHRQCLVPKPTIPL